MPTWLGFFDMVVVLVFVAHWLHTRKAVLPQQRILHCAALSTSPMDYTHHRPLPIANPPVGYYRSIVVPKPTDCGNRAVAPYGLGAGAGFHSYLRGSASSTSARFRRPTSRCL